MITCSRPVFPRPTAPTIALVAVLLSGVPAGVSAQFVDVTNGALAGPGNSLGVAWGDWDNDGDLDLFITNYLQANSLLRNDGGDTFVDVTTGPIGSTDRDQSAAWGDYDNDGDLDLYLATVGSHPNLLFRNDGGGVFADVTAGALGDTGDGVGVTWGDYDNDGDLDIYIANYAFGYSANRLLRNDGNGTFADATQPPLDNDQSTEAVAWADYDNDGDLDLYLVGYDLNHLLRNDGGGTFIEAAPTNGTLTDEGTGMGLAWGDYDNDGDLDIYLSNSLSYYGYTCKLFRNDGDGAWSDATSGPLGNYGTYRGVAFGDFDNDGDLDLYLAKHDGANRLFRNEGDGVWVDATSDPLGDTGKSQTVAWGDYDNDGDLDLYVVNYGSANKLFRNDTANGNHWLQVALLGTVSNRPGIGGRVRVVAGGVSRIREISGGSGLRSQNGMVASFGLGSATHVDSLTVRWPSGIVQAVAPPAVDQRIVVVEGPGVAAVGNSPVPPAIELATAAPNPFQSTARLDFALPRDGHVSLVVHDTQGRRVAILADAKFGAGRHSVVWNGRTSEGRRVGAGVYFVRLVACGQTESRRVAMMP